MDSSHKRRNTEDDVQTYHLDWSVLVTKKFAARAPVEAKEVAGDFLRAMILPANRPRYDYVGAMSACSELLGHLTMVMS